MRRFVYDILIGLVAFIIIWIAGEYAFSKMEVRNNYSYKYNYVKGNPGIKTLFIGHSHFECGVDPYLLDSAFNFAISGRRWVYWDAELAKDLFPTMPNLKTVVFPLGYVMPYESVHYIELDDGWKDYIYWYSKYMHVLYDRFPQNIIYNSAVLRNKMGCKYWQDDQLDSLGYTRRHGMSSVWDGESYFDPELYKGEKAESCYQEFRGYLTEIAKVCAENDIRFVVVTIPCANCFVKNTREQGVRNMYDLIDSVKTYYPIEYFNYLEDVEFRADSIYFNCTHLNSIGADMFTKRLINDLDL